MAVLLPENAFSILALAIALGSIPYAYFGRYKASYVFGGAFIAIFVLQLLTFFANPLDPSGRPCTDPTGRLCFVDVVEYELAMQPAVFLRGEEWWTPVTHMFVHGDMFHIFGNGLSLLLFGPKLEQHIGTRFFASLYLVAGFFAAFVSLLYLPESEVRMLGASGAISGILGLYVMRFPRDQIWLPIGFLPVALPAWGFLIVFILLQFWFSLSGQGIAWWAHLAGLVVGLLVGAWMWSRERARRRGRHYPESAGWTVEHYNR